MLRPPSACVTTFTRGREPLSGLTGDCACHWLPHALSPGTPAPAPLPSGSLVPRKRPSPCQLVYMRKEHLKTREWA